MRSRWFSPSFLFSVSCSWFFRGQFVFAASLQPWPPFFKPLCFPPIILIPQVLRFVKSQSFPCTIVVPGRFPFNKNSGLKFRKLHVLNGTVHSGCTDPTQATARFVIVASQHTHNYALKEKCKYCLYPKEHSTVEKERCKTKGGGILFLVGSL